MNSILATVLFVATFYAVDTQRYLYRSSPWAPRSLAYYNDYVPTVPVAYYDEPESEETSYPVYYPLVSRSPYYEYENQIFMRDARGGKGHGKGKGHKKACKKGRCPVKGGWWYINDPKHGKIHGRWGAPPPHGLEREHYWHNYGGWGHQSVAGGRRQHGGWGGWGGHGGHGGHGGYGGHGGHGGWGGWGGHGGGHHGGHHGGHGGHGGWGGWGGHGHQGWGWDLGWGWAQQGWGWK